MREQIQVQARSPIQFQLLAGLIVLLAISGCGGNQRSTHKEMSNTGNAASDLRSQNLRLMTPSQRLKAKYASIEFICKSIVKTDKKQNVAEVRLNLLEVSQLPNKKTDNTVQHLHAKNSTPKSSMELTIDINDVSMVEQLDELNDVTKVEFSGNFEVTVNSPTGLVSESGPVTGFAYEDGKGLKNIYKNSVKDAQGASVYDVDVSCGFESGLN